MTSTVAFTGDSPYVTFLAAYPFPAFVLDGRHHWAKLGTALQPVYGNSSYVRLVLGPEEASPNFPFGGLVESLLDIDEARRLSAWIQSSANVAHQPPEAPGTIPKHSILLSLRPPWLPADHPVVQLDVTKTYMDGFWVCTSVPRADLPTFTTPTTPHAASPSTETHRKISPKLKIPNFPPPPAFTLATPSPQQSGIHNAKPGDFMSALARSPSPYAAAESNSQANTGVVPGSLPGPSSLTQEATQPIAVVPPAIRPGEMQRKVDTFAWEKTALGPKTGWSQALKTALSICLNSPSSVSQGPFVASLLRVFRPDLEGASN